MSLCSDECCLLTFVIALHTKSLAHDNFNLKQKAEIEHRNDWDGAHGVTRSSRRWIVVIETTNRNFLY